MPDDQRAALVEQYGESLIGVAEKLGFNPTYQGDDAKTPEKFILDIREISRANAKGKQTLERQMNHMERQIGEMHRTYTQVTRNDLLRLRADLETQRKVAMESNDAAAFDKIDGNLRELEKKHGAELDKEPVHDPGDISDTPQEFQTWTGEQTWWKEDPAARAHAETFNENLPGISKISLPERLVLIDKEMEIYFAMQNNQEQQPAVPAAAVPAAVPIVPAAAAPAAPASVNDVDQGGSAGARNETNAGDNVVRVGDLPMELKATHDSYVQQFGSADPKKASEEYLGNFTPQDIADFKAGR